jgi:hypothetical protein
MPKGCISVMVAPELEARMRAIAESEGRSLSNYINGILLRAHPPEGKVMRLAESKPRRPK